MKLEGYGRVRMEALSKAISAPPMAKLTVVKLGFHHERIELNIALERTYRIPISRDVVRVTPQPASCPQCQSRPSSRYVDQAE